VAGLPVFSRKQLEQTHNMATKPNYHRQNFNYRCLQ